MAAYGPNNPGTAATVAAGGVAWTTPNNALVSDGAFATDTGNASSTGDNLQLTNYGFAVPSSAVITGVLVQIQEQSSNTNTKNSTVQLIKGGVAGGTNLGSATAIPSTLQYVSFGGSTNLWGNTLAPSDVNASNFGVQLQVNPIAATTWQASIDVIIITIFTPSVTFNNYQFVTSGGMSITEKIR